MASILKPKRSSTPGAVPTAGSMQQFELAMNTADRKLFVKDHNNNVVEIPTPGIASSIGFTTTEVDLGATPKKNGRFTIATAFQTAGKPVQISQAAGPYTGKGTRADEAEMDTVAVTGYIKDSSTIECFWQCATRVRGNRKFNYLIGA